jgi:hypothetical protein
MYAWNERLGFIFYSNKLAQSIRLFNMSSGGKSKGSSVTCGWRHRGVGLKLYLSISSALDRVGSKNHALTTLPPVLVVQEFGRAPRRS